MSLIESHLNTLHSSPIRCIFIPLLMMVVNQYLVKFPLVCPQFHIDMKIGKSIYLKIRLLVLIGHFDKEINLHKMHNIQVIKAHEQWGNHWLSVTIYCRDSIKRYKEEKDHINHAVQILAGIDNKEDCPSYMV
jgi:hypothetical protein